MTLDIFVFTFFPYYCHINVNNGNNDHTLYEHLYNVIGGLVVRKLTSNHRLSPLWVRALQVAMLRIYSTVTPAVEQGVYRNFDSEHLCKDDKLWSKDIFLIYLLVIRSDY